MRIERFLLVMLLVGLPSVLLAEFNPAGLRPTSNWYFHTDFNEMRTTEAGRHLFDWLDGEVFEEIREEIGIDFGKEANQITASGSKDKDLIVVIDGDISQATQDKVLALAAASGSMDKLEAGRNSYYFVKENGEHSDADEAGNRADNYDLDSFKDGAYFSFAIKNKILVTTSEADMKALLDNKGEFAADRDGAGAMLVLSADRSLVQAGLSTSDFEDDIGWDSNIIRNTKQVALLIADDSGKLAIEAQLLAAEKAMADSLASIARGLISLQIFNDELDPEISQFLQNTSVDVDGTTLTIKVTLDPEAVVAALD